MKIEKSIATIEKTIIEMQRKRIKITTTTIASYSKLSRNTVNKYINDFKDENNNIKIIIKEVISTNEPIELVQTSTFSVKLLKQFIQEVENEEYQLLEEFD